MNRRGAESAEGSLLRRDEFRTRSGIWPRRRKGAKKKEQRWGECREDAQARGMQLNRRGAPRRASLQAPGVEECDGTRMTRKERMGAESECINRRGAPRRASVQAPGAEECDGTRMTRKEWMGADECIEPQRGTSQSLGTGSGRGGMRWNADDAERADGRGK